MLGTSGAVPLPKKYVHLKREGKGRIREVMRGNHV